MAISQSQIVDYLYKKIGYGVAKTDVSTAKSPSNEGNASPLLTTADGIWQSSASIPATIPLTNSSLVTVYSDGLSSTVTTTVDPTTSVAKTTWRTNLIDWIPPQFGATYQVKVYAAPPGNAAPQTYGVLLPPDGSGNNDGWFFDYQAGIVNFADTNIPTAVTTGGNVVYVSGARYTGGKGISNFPGNVTIGNLTAGNYLFPNGISILSGVGSAYGNANVATYLTQSGPITIASGTNASTANTGALQVWGGASVGGNLYVGGNLILQGNTFTVQTQELVATNVTALAYFYANGTPFNYGNVQVAAFLPNYTGSLANSSSIQVLFANAANQGAQLNNLSNIVTIFDANIGLQTTRFRTLDANVGAYEAWANLNFASATGGTIASLSANLGAYQTFANSNLSTTTTSINSINANLAAYQIYANANLGTATNNINALINNAAVQNSRINSLVTGANANIAAYLISTPITIGTLQNQTSVGGNLVVGGDLTVIGNSYVLQTEILTQNEFVVGSMYAGNYFYSNGAPFGSYGNTNVGQYLLNYPGNIGVNYLTANTATVRNTLFAANIVTAGRWGDLTGANVIQANTFAFAGNGVNILTAIPSPYTNANVAAYLPGYGGTIGATDITASSIRSDNHLFANGLSILTGIGGTYSNANVASYLPVHAGNISANRVFPQLVHFLAGNANTGIQSGNLSLPVNNPYGFSGTYALSTTTPTLQNTAGNVALQLGSTSFCIQFQLFLTAAPTAGPFIFGKDQNVPGALIEYYASISNTGIKFSTTAGIGYGGEYAFVPQTNTWYHFAWTSDGTTYRVFLNGQLVSSLPVSAGPISNSGGPLYIGSSARQTNNLTGLIQDFRIDKGTPVYTQNFPPPTNYVGSGPNTVFYLRSWTLGSGLSSATDQTNNTGFFNLRMVGATSPSTVTTSGPYNTTTSGQAILFDGVSSWFSTGGFQVRGTAASFNRSTGALTVGGGAGIAGNLYAANLISTGTITSTGNITANNVVSSNNVSASLFTYANGMNILTGVGGTYTNANVAAFLPTYTGDISAGLVSAGLYTYSNGVNILSGVGLYGNANVATYLPAHTGRVSASSYFYANGTPFNYGNVQVAAYLPTHTGNISGSFLFGNLISIGTDTLVGNIQTIGSGGNITGANVVSANVFTYANGVNILTGVGGIYGNTNVAAYLGSDAPTTIGGNLTVSGNLIVIGNSYVLQTEILTQNEVITGNVYAASYFFSNGQPFVTSTYSNANVANYLPTYSGAISNSSDIIALYANAAAQATVLNTLQSNAAAQSNQINSLVTGANANTAAYLTTATGSISASGISTNTINTTGNVTVGGNLIVVGNSYVLQTEILTQNEVITGNVYAASYFYSNGQPFVTSTYSNANVASYLTTYTGTLNAGSIYGGSYFYSNGTPFNYGNVQAAAYFSTYSGNVSAGSYFYANGTPFNYGNVQVGAYLLTNTGNINSNNFRGNIQASTITSIHGNVTLVPISGGVAVVNATTALQIPKGTTAQRPTGVPGYLRFNIEGNNLEFFDGGAWVSTVNSITQQTIIGDGTTKTFTLDQLTTTVGVLVSINGTVQTPDLAYSVSGSQITFAEAPLATDSVDIRFIVSASATIVDSMLVDSGKISVDTTPVIIDTWPIAAYRSAKYTVSSSTGSQSQISDVWITHDGSTSFISNTTLKTGSDTVHFTTSVIIGNVVLQAYSTVTGNEMRLQRTYFEI